MITLRANGYVLDVDPAAGGSIGRLAYDGVPVLRTCASGADVCDTACYPLVPYANRIENGIMTIGGRYIRLAPNMGDHPHPLHGHGWRTAWRTVAADDAALVLAFEHAADEWPWAYAAEQRFALDEAGLYVGLSVQNLAAEAMPVSLGLHPFFPRTAGTVLQAKVGGVWLADESCIPTRHAPAASVFDPSLGAALADAPSVDHCYSGWDGVARIVQPRDGLAVTMQASSDCAFLHCFLPQGADFLAVEPVSAMPNSFNRPEGAAVTGARLLPPGERFAIEMRILATRL